VNQGIGNAFLGKVPPHSTEAELSVIGGCLLHPTKIADVAEEVTHEDFYGEAHRVIFEAIIALHRERKTIDMIRLGEYLKSRGELEHVGGLAYLSSLLDAVPTSAAIIDHARVIRETASVRRGIGVCLDFLQSGYGEYGDADEWMSKLVAETERAAVERDEPTIRPVSETINETFMIIGEQHARGVDITGIPTGYPTLDKMTAGLQDGDLYILAARPSMGKTAMLLNMFTHAAYQGYPGIIFSAEMSNDQLNRRLLSSEANVSCHRLRLPKDLTEEDLINLLAAADRLKKIQIYVDDSADITIHQVRNRSRRLARKMGIRIIGVDYLQILESENDAASRERQIAEMTRGGKALAKELRLPVVMLSQLNRGPENRQDKRPNMSDLRESGAIEQDADDIFFIFRESQYDPEAGDDAEIIIGKNRSGPTGTVHLRYRDEFMRFEEPARGFEEQRNPDLPPLPPLGDDGEWYD